MHHEVPTTRRHVPNMQSYSTANLLGLLLRNRRLTPCRAWSMCGAAVLKLKSQRHLTNYK